MARGTLLPRRPLGEWAIRALLALVAVCAGYYAVTQAAGFALRRAAVDRAYALAPGDGRIIAALSAKLASPEASPAERQKSDDLARAALLADPTAVAGVATLGLNAQVRGDSAAARRAFAYSETLSRRDLRTQIWAIEDAVAREDIPGALRYYDTALRTSSRSRDLLFPVLATAIADADIRAALVPMLATKPSWGKDFIEYAAGNGPSPQATASLLNGLARTGFRIPATATASVVNALITAGDFEGAWTYYAVRNPGVDRRAGRDADFTGELDHPSAFDWLPSSDPGLTATIQRGERGGIFDFAVPPSIGGVLIQQLQMLPPGEYVLEGHSIDIEQSREALPYWILRCHSGRELGRVNVPASAEAGGGFAGRITIPDECPVQVLALVARPSNKISGVTGQIDRISLRPMR